MNKQYLVIMFLSLLLACASSQQLNTLSKSEGKEQWQLLFDGKTTNGWHKYGGAAVGASWKVEEGSLHLDPSGKSGGDIVTDREFENYHLKLEWKISGKGNSGIIFYVHEAAQYKYPWETGPEMQVIDNDGHVDGKIRKHRAGDLYDLIACSRETVKPVGDWNKMEIKCMNGKLELMLNGVTVITTTLWDESWKKLVAESKFKSMPGFGIYKKGHISLQDHGDKVWFRNIRIREF
jgi:hypothetical protein